MCVGVYLSICVIVSRLLAKRKTIQTWNLANILPLTLSKNGFFVFSIKSPWGEQPVKDFLKFTRICVCLCIYVFIYLCHFSWPDEKRYTPDIWHTYSRWTYLKTVFFLFFWIKSPWRPLSSKNCRVTWIFRISPRLPSLYYICLYDCVCLLFNVLVLDLSCI